jgi:hypothetical protein
VSFNALAPASVSPRLSFTPTTAELPVEALLREGPTRSRAGSTPAAEVADQFGKAKGKGRKR